jgi:hypothetical protein
MATTMTPITEIWLPKTGEGKRVVLFTITPIPGKEKEAAEKLEQFVTHWANVEQELGPHNIFIEKSNPFVQLVVEGIE